MDLEHGGNVGAAARRFNIPASQWMDLSTGISPWSWPVPPVPSSVWQNLPQADGQLERAAAAYYRCDPSSVLAVPGSQFALQFMPASLPRARVAMPACGYAEHRLAWHTAGHQIVDYRDGAALHVLVKEQAVEHALVIHPNNPTGELLSRSVMEDLHRQLQRRGGWLVVDEAFVDANPADSLAPLCPSPGLIVYRSLGKFFGLAGLRLGFLLAPPAQCAQLAARMTPWLVSHPARWIGERALADGAWQQEQRIRLAMTSAHWLQSLQASLPELAFSATAFFTTGSGTFDYCRSLYTALARRALLVRLFDNGNGEGMLRFGLPVPTASESALQLLRDAAEECVCALQ